MPTHEANRGDQGVTRVGAAGGPPAVHPEGRSVRRRSTAVPRAAVFGATGADLWDEDVEPAAAADADAWDDADRDVVAASCRDWLAIVANAPLSFVTRLRTPPARAAAKIPTNVHLTARRQCSMPSWAMFAPSCSMSDRQRRPSGA